MICAIVLIGIVGKGVYELYERSQKKKAGADFAAANTSEKLKTFAVANRSSGLGGVAHLQLADEAYAAGNYTQAAQYYQSATDSLGDPALAARARLGQAISKIQGGQTAEGEAQLKALASAPQQLKTVRAEACYHLASLCAGAGRTDDAVKYLDQLNGIEPAGLWAQRALSLRSTLPPQASSAAGDAMAAPQIKLPGSP
jgi:tetratricopeptide (TPR) repeat protein